MVASRVEFQRTLLGVAGASVRRTACIHISVVHRIVEKKKYADLFRTSFLWSGRTRRGAQGKLCFIHDESENRKGGGKYLGTSLGVSHKISKQVRKKNRESEFTGKQLSKQEFFLYGGFSRDNSTRYIEESLPML